MNEEDTNVELGNEGLSVQDLWDSAEFNPLEMIPPPGASRKDLAKTIATRSHAIIKSGYLMYEEAQRLFGERDHRTVALRVFNSIGVSLNQIAEAQLDTFDPQVPTSQSWRSYHSDACQEIEKQVGEFLTNETDEDFRKENPEFAQCLQIIAERLLDETSPQGFKQISHDLEQQTIYAIENKRQVFLLFPFDDYYSDPDRRTEEIELWEADAQLMFALPQNTQEKVMTIDEEARERMSGLFQHEQSTFYALAGNAVIGYGTECLSLTAGRAFEHGFELGINLLEKKRIAWEKGDALFGKDCDFDDVLDDLMFLYFAHERGHRLSKAVAGNTNGDTRLLDEARTDLPSVIAAFERKMEDTVGMELPQKKKALHRLIRLLFLTFTSEGAEIADDDGDVMRGYKTSAHLVLNELLNCGLVKKNGEGPSFAIDPIQEKIETLVGNLREIHEKLAENDPQTIALIKATIPREEVREAEKVFVQ